MAWLLGKIKLRMEALDTQFPDGGLDNSAQDNELNNDSEIRNETDMSGNGSLAGDVDGLEVDADDPVDLAFWAEQFEISPDDLKRVVLNAGKSIDAITHYLQK